MHAPSTVPSRSRNAPSVTTGASALCPRQLVRFVRWRWCALSAKWCALSELLVRFVRALVRFVPQISKS